MKAATMLVRVNGEKREVAAGATLEALLATLAVRRDGIAVALNDDVVPRSGFATHVVREGDRVEIIVAVAGG